MMTNTFIGPVILIILGGVFLLNNFGVLPWDVWFSLWKFWPVILILVGVEILLGKSASVRTFVILIGLIFFIPIFLSYNPITNNPLNTEEIKIEETLGTAIKAKISLDFPTSNIEIDSLDTDSNFLAEGKIVYSQASKQPEIGKKDEANEVHLNLTQSFEGKLPFISNLKTSSQLSFTPVVPIEINIKTGASNMNIDLSELKTEYLEVNSGAASINIKFAEDFEQKVLIKTGASTVTLEIPERIAAKASVDSQVKSVDAADRFESKENVYQTKGFEKAQIKVTIEVKAGAGSVVIR